MEATKKVAEGNYDTEIPPTNHKDTIGKMQNAFRHMQQTLISRREDIRQNDEKIAKDSAELEQALPPAQEASERRKLFIQDVSRQFATPLNIIDGLARVLQDKITSRHRGKVGKNSKSGEDISHICTTMKQNAVLLNRTTLMLYDISETGVADTSRYNKTDRVSCNELGRECINYIEGVMDSPAIVFETDLPDSLSIKSNWLFMERTIRELLRNAVKFSDGQHILLRLTQTDTTVRYTVEDVGPGIPSEAKKLIFVPFMKVDNQSEGLGLGLPLCKAHMDGLGGIIGFDENYQQGCSVFIELPKD
jgi:signal transduction histidine kinase